jgi:serine protease
VTACEIVPDPLPELPPDPEPLPPPRPRAEPSGIVVVLDPGVPAGETDDLDRHADDNADRLGPLRDFLVRNGRPRATRLVTVLPPDALREAEERARDSAFPPLESLTRYWRIDVTGLRGRKTPEELVEELLAAERGRPTDSRGVARAYVEPVAQSPAAPVAVAPLTVQSGQGWLRARPEGVDAWAGWAHAGGDGAGIGVVDVEQGWQFTHPDVDGLVGAPLVHLNRFDESPAEGDHGTSVLGIVAGRANRVGGTGIAPAASVAVCSHYDGTETVRTVDAVLAARAHLAAGDVLLVEVHLPTLGYLCAEADDATFHALRLASAAGIVVVEAAGNGSADLSAWAGPSGRRLDRDVPELDSGAIVVAACRSGHETDATGVQGHRWNQPAFSNYGVRVDCHAWGDAVQAPVVDDYDEFGGTSAAAAIVAGVVAAVQGMRVAAGLPRLETVAMRELLRSTPGTPQVPVTSLRLIGAMPDLAALAAAVGALPAAPGPLTPPAGGAPTPPSPPGPT